MPLKMMLLSGGICGGRYFKVKTWEELKAMADVYPVIEDAAI